MNHTAISLATSQGSSQSLHICPDFPPDVWELDYWQKDARMPCQTAVRDSKGSQETKQLSGFLLIIASGLIRLKPDDDSAEYGKGKEFETFVEAMFPTRDFEILQRSHPEGSKLPDLYIRDRKTVQKFWVEAKWRASLFDDKFKLCEKDRLESYRAFQKGVRPETVFMVLGLGGQPSAPDEIYCFSLDEIKHPSLFRSVLRGGKHEHASFRYEKGELI